MNAIELSLFASRINAICEQMGTVLQQTAISPNIRDRLDYSCAIFDIDGQLCAQAAHIPVHLGSMAYAMRDIVHQREWQEGDTVILNDPYQGGTHLPDISFISPVFVKGQLHAFVANRAHHADIGADSPGSMPISKSIEEEGLIIPTTLIGKKNEIIDSVLNNLVSTLRNRDLSRADFKAQFSVNQKGIVALQDLIHQYQDDTFQGYLHSLNNYARKIAKQSLSKVPHGDYEFSDVMDDDGLGKRDISIQCVISVRQDEIVCDFTGTSEQVIGNINCPISVTAAAVYYCFRCLMPEYTPNCAGSFDFIKINVPKNNLLNANYPAAVAAGNVETSTRIVDVVFGALANALPDQVPAASHGSMNNIAMGADNWSYYETIGGGMGASKYNNGCDAIQTHMTNTLNTPIEVLEINYPLLMKNYAIRASSGGTGMNHGGKGIIRHYKFLEKASVTLLTERRRHAPWGLANGGQGKPGVNSLNQQKLPAKTTLNVEINDELTIETPGGGGYGEPEN
ncbi:MAG: hydantoinase B/oxoprolinase family protein [Pseudomonadota bacterium]